MSDGMTLASEHGLCGHGRAQGSMSEGQMSMSGSCEQVQLAETLALTSGSVEQQNSGAASISLLTTTYPLYISLDLHKTHSSTSHQPRRRPADPLAARETAFGCLREIGQQPRLTPSRAIYISSCRTQADSQCLPIPEAQWPVKGTSIRLPQG
jgi:hypothetical protein